MSEKSRNFRSSYYDKVGFRGVEEKKSLEILISEKPMDKEKLKKFCLRFTLPSMHREFVWKVLLGVLPLNSESHESIMNQRHEHYRELEHSLEVMFKINDNTSRSLVHTLMFLMTEDVIEFKVENQLSNSKSQNLIALASFFIKLSSSEAIAYWIFKNFVLHQRNYSCPFKSMKENFEIILKKEDDALYEHFKLINAFRVLPLEMWFERCFAEVLHESSLVRIFDKMIGGSYKILPFMATALLVSRRHLLLPLRDASEIASIFEDISKDPSEIAVNKALEMYYS